MELAEIRPFEPQMAEIDLFTMPDAVGVGEPSVRKQKPYIAGHVTDGSSTFTFTVNGNESVTVPVDANGNWKWVVDRTVTSLYEAFRGKTNIDKVELACKFDDLENLYYTFANCSYLQEVKFKEGIKLSNVTNADHTFSNCSRLTAVNLQSATLEKVTTVNRFFNNCIALTVIDLGNAIFNDNARFPAFCYGCKNATTINLNKALFVKGGSDDTIAFSACDALAELTLGTLKFSLTFANSNLLTEQSVVNLFNAVAADGITLTFHATVYAMIEQQLEIEGSPIYEAYWNSDYDFNYASA